MRDVEERRVRKAQTPTEVKVEVTIKMVKND